MKVLKKVLSYLMMGCLALTLTACFGRGTAPSIPQTVNVFPSDSLLVNPCRAKPAGESLVDLALAQNRNVGCFGLWEKEMDAIRMNKKSQMELYHAK
jgi:hypothetical protein